MPSSDIDILPSRVGTAPISWLPIFRTAGSAVMHGARASAGAQTA